VDFSVTVDEPYLVTLGDNVWLTDDVKILTHDGALSMLSRTTGEKLRKFGAVRLGNNVFVGMAACLMPGVTLGDNTVVATGSVVTRDIPSGVIVGGNPARELARVEDYLAKWRDRQEDFGYRNSAEKRPFLVRHLLEGV
jgi:acetyltransferase-like isoleucine patch superfamily enzyme